MGLFLTFRGNAKANPTTGALPDENYAREVMQLFTIGLVQLNADGTPAAQRRQPGRHLRPGRHHRPGARLHRLGLRPRQTAASTATPDFKRRPMVQVASRHETGAKTFLGTTIPAGTDGAHSLTMALDAIFAPPQRGAVLQSGS